MLTPSIKMAFSEGCGVLITLVSARPSKTSSGKFTFPCDRKTATSSFTLINEGRIGKIGFLQVFIFSLSSAYTSPMGNKPGLPKITAIPSKSKSFSQASIISPNCAAVPVARKSMGFSTEEPANSFSFKADLAGESSICGIFSPPLSSASVSITPGPPA